MEYQKRNVKRCLRCGTKITGAGRTGLCVKCLRVKQYEDLIASWLKTKHTGCKPGSKNPPYIKKYLLNEQNHKCAICGCTDVWNGKPLVFIVDHIDGNAANDARENLRMVCPNCDSQLDTYKSKNKHSARTHRAKYT